MQIIKLNPKNTQAVVGQARKVLENSGLVVFPSDTVYGLAANALSKKAVEKLFKFKERPANQSVSIALPNLEQAKNYVQINQNQEHLLKSLLPGPYTIVLPSRQLAISKLEAEDQTLGIRIPGFWFTNTLSQALPFPYTATSANLHSKGPHHTISALLNTLSETKKALLDLVIDLGELPPNLPSTVINLSERAPQIIRQGEKSFRKIKTTSTKSPEETRETASKLAKEFASKLPQKPVVFILQGLMGTGKTVFSQGVGHYFGIKRIVSPTYVIYYEYLSPLFKKTKLHHFDLYRLESDRDLTDLGITKLLKPQNFLLVEWGEHLGSIESHLKQIGAIIVLIQIKELSVQKRQFDIFEL